MSPQLESPSNKRLLHRKVSKTCRQAKLRRLRRLLHFSGAYHLELFPDYMDYLHRFVKCMDYRYEDNYRCKDNFLLKLRWSIKQDFENFSEFYDIQKHEISIHRSK